MAHSPHTIERSGYGHTVSCEDGKFWAGGGSAIDPGSSTNDMVYKIHSLELSSYFRLMVVGERLVMRE